MNRRTFLGLALAATPSLAHAQADAAAWVRGLLESAASDPMACGQEEAAARGTLDRLQDISLPDRGKVLVVNIPSGVVTAYEDGHPVIESRAVVGRDSTPTPELDTRVTIVRPNPTWTVPESILSRKDWRTKLRNDPSFFEENGFDLITSDGATLSPWEAAQESRSVARFVQRPGPGNALGLLKIGLHASDGIYLHDTNEPSRYDADIRAASAGCVRIEHIRDIAAWVLGTGRSEIDAMIEDGDMQDYSPSGEVRVILGYWTAWPDADGMLRYYPDIYGLDGEGSECGAVRPPAPESPSPGQSDSGSAWGSYSPVWSEYEAR